MFSIIDKSYMSIVYAKSLASWIIHKNILGIGRLAILVGVFFLKRSSPKLLNSGRVYAFTKM